MTMLINSRVSRSLSVALALGLSLGLVLPFVSATPAVADTAPADPANPATPVTVSADALPTVQIDGVAWSQVVVGSTVYVAGEFTTARPAGSAPGQNTVPRHNLLAYNIETGNLISTFSPNLNGQALSVTASPDGSRIYVGGDFTTVNGSPYYRIAAFSTATGQVIPSFKPAMGSQVRAITATNTTVYAGGTFQSVNGQTRRFLAAMNASNGSLTNWTADADAMVYAITLTTDHTKVIAGGRFAHVEGANHYGLVALDSATGDTLPWAAPAQVRNGGPRAAIMSLHATADRVYGSGYVYGSNEDGNLEGIFSADPNTGEIQWVEDCHGDTVSVWTLGDVVYGAGHPHYCGNIGGFPQTEPWTMHHTVAFSKAATGVITPDPYGYFNWAGTPSPSLLNWFPDWVVGNYTNQGQAVWNLSGNDRYITAAGDFPYVNGTAQYGLTRFAIEPVAPNKVGPVVNPELVPAAASFSAGEVRVSWTATYDRDNTHLSYRVVRVGGGTVYQTTQDSNFWTRPAMGFIDTGLTPGQVVQYRVYVSDPHGNEISRLGSPVTVSAENSSGPYSDAVEANNPDAFWPLDESAGRVGFDHVGFTDLQLDSGVSRGVPGAIAGSTASRFDGTAGGFGVTQSAIPAPNTFTTEAWIRTTSTDGGKIIGFGNQKSGLSTNYDRHVYMDNAGRIWFGAHPGGVRTVNSSAPFNDGQWHQVVASMGSNGMRLWVDGMLVGSRDDVTSGQGFEGFWRVGGDNLNGWTNRPNSSFLAGDIALVSLYPTVLNRSAIIDHLVASGRPSPIPPAPADSYGAAIYHDDPTLYWRLNETAGNSATDSGPLENHGQYDGSVTKGVPGALAAGTGTAAHFTQPSGVSSNRQFTNPTSYSLETWFKTTTQTGGKLIGFGNERTGLSSNYDRHLYMQDNGALVFGTWTGFTNTITSPNSYNDGAWHHAVVTQSSNGMAMYVDGGLVGTNGQTAAQDYSGYWRIGGDNTWGSSSQYFTGNLDEVAVYPSALSASRIAEHYALGSTGTIPNQRPNAEFSSSVSDLTVAFDASASADPDGTINSYEWNFGDGATATGVSPTHDYATAGEFTVTLTVTDNDSATGSVAHTVTTTAPPVNLPPVAAFTSSSSGLSAMLDGTGSSDPDGTIASYSWGFGDGQSATGATPSHPYATSGTYSVSLTVTDNQGATNTVTHDVTVTAPPSNLLAQDAFERTVTSGWGAADVGGPWAVTGNPANLRVGGGSGHVDVPAGSTRTTMLPAVASTDADSRVEFSLNRVPTGGGAYLTVVGRQVGSASYSADIWVRSTGAVFLVTKQGSTALDIRQIPGLTYTAGTELQLRFQVTGTSPTTLRAKVWPSSATEPAAWQATVNDSSGALQQAGAIGLKSYLSGSATAPITVSYDNLNVTSGTPAANAAPVAAFTSSATGLNVAFNAAGSTDSDGTIASYGWNFGDGTNGTGVNPSHNYPADGTYTVQLTVTDDDGATSTVSHDVAVSAPVNPAGLAVDDFETATTNGWGTASVGGAWTHAGAASAYAKAGGFGVQVIPNGSTKTSSLSSVSSSAVNLRVSFSADKPATGGGIYVSAIGRDVGSTIYQARVWMQSTGEMRLQLLQGGTQLQMVIPGLSYTPGATYQLRLEVFGTSPTTIRAKVWADGQAEPAAWQASVTDATAALQGAGSLGLRSYVSASATAIPVTVRFDNLLVQAQQ